MRTCGFGLWGQVARRWPRQARIARWVRSPSRWSWPARVIRRFGSALGGALSVAAVPILAYYMNLDDQGSNEMSGKHRDGPSFGWLSRLRRYLPKNASM
jgi:hypothetical protein